LPKHGAPYRDTFAFGLRTGAASLRGALSTPDGRWTLVSTLFVATVSAAITWLTLAAEPSGPGYEPRRTQATLPYDLFARLMGTNPAPGIAAEDARSALYRQASLIPGLQIGNAARTATYGVTEQNGVRVHRGPDRRKLTVGEGDTLMGILTEAGVPSPDAAAIVTALAPIFSPRNIRPGQVLEASFLPLPAADTQRIVRAGVVPISVDSDDDRASVPPAKLLSLSFTPNIEHTITVKLNDDGEYDAEDLQKELEPRYAHAGATIQSSLYLAAMQAGIPASVVVEMIRMFSYDVDFQRDVRPGDKFEVFYNSYYTPEGVEAKAGDIHAATMVLAGKRRTLYRFETADGVEYFDENGRSAKNMLMKTPVDGARLSSGFGMRFHPVLGYTRMHKGIDFAVPTGTPVMAAGSGTIQYAGRQRGYGNFIIVNHGNGYATAYGHLSRFAGSIRVGTRVRQGQTIGFSGMTGIATGPHLHYEIRINHTQVNPLRVKVAQGRRLGGRELKAFLAQRARADHLLASLPLQRTVAQADAGLRDGTDE
jgi:murein DD-endopeptidase MepM/ murein hydrolase activator NlpD